jgi:hypothetical protein
VNNFPSFFVQLNTPDGYQGFDCTDITFDPTPPADGNPGSGAEISGVARPTCFVPALSNPNAANETQFQGLEDTFCSRFTDPKGEQPAHEYLING